MEKNVVYLFAPGLWACESQAGKYCKKMVASTKQTIKSGNDIEVLLSEKVISCNFAEVELKAVREKGPWYQRISLRPWDIGSYFINSVAPFFIRKSYANHSLEIKDHDEQTHTIAPYRLKVENLNFGQEKDIEILSERYDQCLKENSDAEIILYGFSRGAAATFNFMATLYQEKEIKRVKAIILEGCFDSISHILPENLSCLLAKILPHYTHKGIEPIEEKTLQSFVETCQQYSIPILLITSKKDRRVPSKNVRSLYQALLETGLNNMELLELEHSSHAAYLKDHEEDKRKLASTIHEFYKKYDLPYGD